MKKVYAGIGARKTPKPMLDVMELIGQRFAEAGWLLRSGGAVGADSAFERGCNLAHGMKKIYTAYSQIPDKCFEIVREVHPNPGALSPFAWLLHARSVMQIFGDHLDELADLVICWTPGGEDVGGTRTAIVLARQAKIPIINLGSRDGCDVLMKFMQDEGMI